MDAADSEPFHLGNHRPSWPSHEAPLSAMLAWLAFANSPKTFHRKKGQSLAAKLSRWIIFTILFSLIPLFVDSIAETVRTGGSFDFSTFGRHGELYVLASAVCAVGLGELLGVNQKLLFLKILGGGAALIVISAATALFTLSASDAAISVAHQAADQIVNNEKFAKQILGYSGTIFIFACIISTSCIVLSEV